MLRSHVTFNTRLPSKSLVTDVTGKRFDPRVHPLMDAEIIARGEDSSASLNGTLYLWTSSNLFRHRERERERETNSENYGQECVDGD
mmetsp:Transcript_5208/g.10622  ORF Transcript_5208/g.10622 Transcript_5208/m.10622 type:complete len:87 (-) Transcript_5208:274-534(-)